MKQKTRLKRTCWEKEKNERVKNQGGTGRTNAATAHFVFREGGREGDLDSCIPQMLGAEHVFTMRDLEDTHLHG